MMDEPRTYRHSTAQLVLALIVIGMLAVGLFFAMGPDNYIALLPFAVILLFTIIIFVYTLTVRTTISDTEISTQTILGMKSLGWSEINRVSGSGYAIKLRNLDGDVTVAPSPQLPKYEEVIEWIGVKRPDLFDPQEYSEMTKSWTNYIVLAFAALFLVGVAFFAFTQSSSGFIPLIFLFIIGIFVVYMTVFSPQALSIEGNSLLIRYFFSQRTLLADEIKSINLRFSQTRNGKNFFILLTLADGKSIRVSGIKPNLPVAYLVLKNWHKKNIPNGQTSYEINTRI